MTQNQETVLNGRYVILRQVKAWIGSPTIKLGEKDVCRYCGCRDRT